MSSRPYRLQQLLLAPLPFVVLLGRTPHIHLAIPVCPRDHAGLFGVQEELLLGCYCVVAVAAHVHYGMLVVRLSRALPCNTVLVMRLTPLSDNTVPLFAVTMLCAIRAWLVC